MEINLRSRLFVKLKFRRSLLIQQNLVICFMRGLSDPGCGAQVVSTPSRICEAAFFASAVRGLENEWSQLESAA